MPSSTRLLTTLASLVLGTTLVTVVPLTATPAQAAAAVATAPLKGFADLLVDEPHGQVFLSQGGSRGVVVADLAGRRTGTLADSAGATAMTLSADGETLYLAINNARRITAVDLETLATTSWDSAACPSSMAEVSGMLVYGTFCPDTAGYNEVYVLDPASGVSTEVWLVSDGGELTTSPSFPGDVFISSIGTSRPGLHRATLDLSGEAPDLVDQASFAGDSSTRIAFLPDGERVVTAQGVVLDATTLRRTGTVYSRPRQWVNGVVVRPDGLTAFTTSGRPTVVYAPGTTTPLNSYYFSSEQGGGVYSGGMATSSTHLYLVTYELSKQEAVPVHPQLHVVVPRGPSTLTLRTPRRSYRCGTTVSVSVRRTGPSASRRVTITGSEAHGGPIATRTVRLSAAGRGSFRHRLRDKTTFLAAIDDQGARVTTTYKVAATC